MKEPWPNEKFQSWVAPGDEDPRWPSATVLIAGALRLTRAVSTSNPESQLDQAVRDVRIQNVPFPNFDFRSGGRKCPIVQFEGRHPGNSFLPTRALLKIAQEVLGLFCQTIIMKLLRKNILEELKVEGREDLLNICESETSPFLSLLLPHLTEKIAEQRRMEIIGQDCLNGNSRGLRLKFPTACNIKLYSSSAPECHASNLLKLLNFFLSIVRLQQYFVGACQRDFGFLWRACHCAANRYLAAVVG